MSTPLFGRLHYTGSERTPMRYPLPKAKSGPLSDPKVQKYADKMTNHQRHIWARKGYFTNARKLAALLRK